MLRIVVKALLLVLVAVPTSLSADKAFAGTAGSIHLSRWKAGRAHPLIAIAADNAGTETTDLIIPYGVFKGAEVGDVVIASTGAGVVNLMPALKIKPDLTMSEFDAANPQGADIVIVPAMHDDRNETVINWVRRQQGKGATIVSICEGAWLAARAGVFDGRAATTHWYAFDKIARMFPRSRWVHDQRYVFDRNAMSTTGITASIPASLALVEAIAGRRQAQAAAARLGVEDWNAAYDSAPFRLTAGRRWVFSRNVLAFWGHETIRMSVADGFDEIALALTADAWSRTYRSQAIVAQKQALIRSRHGLMLVPDGPQDTGFADVEIPQEASVKALDHALEEIAVRYGGSTADIVALQLEYPVK